MAAAPHQALSLRELNRALLARQLLLRRERLTPARAIERLGALQAQWAPAPYIALWSRLEGFTVRALEQALHKRQVVKATLMRGTLHLVSARDYAVFGSTAPEARQSIWGTTQRYLVRQYGGDVERDLLDGKKVHALLLRYAKTPRSREQLVAFMAKATSLPPEVAVHLVWSFIAAHGGLVHVPPSGTWAHRLAGEQIAARAWLPRLAEAVFEDAAVRVVRRHLEAFGPASVDDISSWTSIRTPPIRDALKALGAKVTVSKDAAGRTLYDMAGAPRPEADTAAPVRFLAKWDSPLLAYAPVERARILPEQYRKAVIIKNGDVAQTFLVDGFVAGTWNVRMQRADAVLTLKPFAKLAKGTLAALTAEGERLARFVQPEAREHVVRT